MSQTDAYLAAYPHVTKKTAGERASRLAKTDKVVGEIARLRAEVEKGVVRTAIITRQQACEFLSAVVTTPLSEVTKESKLAHRYNPETREIQLPAKIEAIRELAKMEGWYAPEKVQVSGPVEVLAKLMGVRSK